MYVFFEVKPKTNPFTIARRSFNRIRKMGWDKIGGQWIRDSLPVHFTREGETRYKYGPRAGQNLPRGTKGFRASYFGRKVRRTGGHPLPLVWTGQSRQRALLGSYVKPTSLGAKIVIPAPALNYRHPRSRIRMRDEVTRVMPDEEQTLARKFNAIVAKQLNNLNYEHIQAAQ